MSVRRALVDCAVLSLQDARVFYPYCKGCFSKMDPEPQQPKRLSCFKCGYSCFKEQVDYRYRLSLKVARNTCVFGVTVFGTCLNPFFGIHASGLQRLVEDLNGPVEVSTRSTLLQQAVQDCFIGRHFIFGIKVTETERGPWLEGAPVSSRSDMAQFTASQMILPEVRCLEGCAVVTYYRALVQKAVDYELACRGLCRSPRLPVMPLMLVPSHSSNSSLCNATLCASGFLSQSLQRSQQQDSVLSPTPPWQQSLGLVTSSAEQEEIRGTQDEDGRRRISGDIQTPRRANTGAADTRPSGLLSLHGTFSDSPSFLEEASGNTPVLLCVSPSLYGHTMASPLSSKTTAFSAHELSGAVLSDSVALDDGPFSESPTERLREDMNGSEKQHHKDSRVFLDVTNRAAVNNGGEGRDERVNMSRTPDVRLRPWNRQDEEDEAGSVYNGSADLFSCSSDMDSSSEMHDRAPLEGVRAIPTVTRTTHTLRTHSRAAVRSLRRSSDKQQPQTGAAPVTHSTPHTPALTRTQCHMRDGFGTPESMQALEFIPPSQSTPVGKAPLVSGSREKSQKISSPICKVNRVSSSSLESVKENVVRSTTHCSNRRTPERSFWKADGPEVDLQAQQQQQLRVWGGAPNTGSRRRTNHGGQPDVPDVSVCDYDDREAIVPPTPAAETRRNTKTQRRGHADASRFPRGGRGAGEKKSCCKRKLLEQTVRTQSDRVGIERHVRGLPGNGEKSDWDFTAADEEVSGGCGGDLSGDDNPNRDCSRDLFV